MACSLCGEECRCSLTLARTGDPVTSILIDPEEPDVSEEQFAASLMASNAGRSTLEEEWGLVGSAAPQAPEAAGVPVEIPTAAYDLQWKQEVSSRLQSYRARRGGKRPRYEGSLSLDFERAANRMLTQEEAAPEPPGASCEPALAEAVSMGTGEPSPETEPEDGAESNVIEFPRSPTLFEPVMPPCGDELAEPVIDRPRILEAPEAVHTSEAPLAGIELAADEPEPAPELELPLGVAAMGQRAFAAIVDGTFVAVATAVFLTVVMRGEVPTPQGKVGVALVVALPLVLWAIYEYLFLVHAGQTPGMKLAHLALVDFENCAPGRRVRRERALATVLSVFSLGLGVMWALLDEDELCWHDRISRTYVMRY